jgi:hypothetical protein
MQYFVRKKKIIHVRHLLLLLHLIVTTWLVILIFVDNNGFDTSFMVLPAVFVYCVTLALQILKLKKIQDFLTPLGIVSSFFYLVFYIKFLILHCNKSFYFPSWIYIDSPLYFASHEWGDAFVFFVCAYLLFILFYKLSMGHCSSRFIAERSVQAGGGASKRVLMKFSRQFIILGFMILAFRYIATQFLGLGQSVGSETNLLNVPYLGGIIQLFTLWGGRLVLATAFALSLATNSRNIIYTAAALNIFYGIISMISTGSKAELLVPVLIISTILFFNKDRANRFVKKTILYGAFILFVVGVLLYPAMHNYRYVKKEISAIEYLLANSENMNVYVGLSQIVARLTGLEGFANILSYNNRLGRLPQLSLNYQPYVVYQLFGISKHVKIGIGVGIIGGAYLIGGLYGLFLFSCMFGIVCGKLYYFQRKSNVLWSAKISFVVVSYLILLNMLLFSGNLLFDFKQIFVFVITFYFIKRLLNVKFEKVHQGYRNGYNQAKFTHWEISPDDSVRRG